MGIYIGINDVWHSTNGRGTPKDQFDAGLRDLVEKITAAGAKVVLCTPSTIGEKTDGSNPLDPLLEEYSAISRKVAEETGVTLCDLRKAFLDHLKQANPDNKDRGILTGDGVHLNGTLYQARDARTPLPCIFTLTPYISQSYHDRGMYFAAHGYVFMTIDARGRGNSGGDFTPLLQEAKDGQRKVQKL